MPCVEVERSEIMPLERAQQHEDKSTQEKISLVNTNSALEPPGEAKEPEAGDGYFTDPQHSDVEPSLPRLTPGATVESHLKPLSHFFSRIKAERAAAAVDIEKALRVFVEPG